MTATPMNPSIKLSPIWLASIVALLLWITAIAILWLIGPPSQTSTPVPVREAVMRPGMVTTAQTPIGRIKVSAGTGTQRVFEWDGCRRSVEMVPRPERWYGALGLYYPGTGRHWSKCGGISRLVAWEAEQHFASEAEALAWVKDQNIRWSNYLGEPHSRQTLVYRSDGLVVGWGKVPARQQLNVDTWQIMINGKKPTALAGADDDAIAVERDPGDESNVHASCSQEAKP